MRKGALIGLAIVSFNILTGTAWAAQSGPQDILKQALLGAGSGALSAEMSGGKAGTGALVGAGTHVIGGALLSALFDGPSTSYAPSYSYAQAPVQTVYSQPSYSYQPVQYQPREVYVQPVSYVTASAPALDSNRQIIRNGLMGAGVGAISAEVSGGKAGTGALVGAGTNVIGGALLDTLMGPSQASQPAPQYYYSAPQYSAPQYYNGTSASALQKRIVRHFDKDGTLVSEEEFYE